MKGQTEGDVIVLVEWRREDIYMYIRGSQVWCRACRGVFWWCACVTVFLARGFRVFRSDFLRVLISRALVGRPWSSLYLNLLQQLANLLAQRLLVLDLPLGHPLPKPLEDLSRDAFGLAFFLLETGDDAAQDLGDGGRFERSREEGGDKFDLFGKGRTVRVVGGI